MKKLPIVMIMILSVSLSLLVFNNRPAQTKQESTVVAVDIKPHNLIDAKRQAGTIRVSRSFVRKEPVAKKKIHKIKKVQPVEHERKKVVKHPSSKVSLSGVAACIAKYESGGNPRAENPNSSASGLYQFIDGTWNNYGGYRRAKDAPVSVQTAKFYQVWAGGKGAHHWVVAHKCGY